MTRVEDSTTWVLKRGSSEAGEFKLGLLEFKDELPIFFFVGIGHCITHRTHMPCKFGAKTSTKLVLSILTVAKSLSLFN